MDWEHLRTFEAVARLGSLTAAAQALGVSQSTVSRQLQQLESRAGSPLLMRTTPVQLTQRGIDLRAAVLPMIESSVEAEAVLDSQPELRGVASISTVAEVSRWVLAPGLPAFYAEHPRLQLRILSDNRVTSLSAGDADIALRFARPERGDLVARAVHTEDYSLFVASSLTAHSEMPWLGLTGSLANIPEQRHAERMFLRRPARLLLEDLESLGRAVQLGLGVAMLPVGFAQRLQDVTEVSPTAVGGEDIGPLPSRQLWMVVHRAKQRVPKLRAVMDWIAGAFDDSARVAP